MGFFITSIYQGKDYNQKSQIRKSRQCKKACAGAPADGQWDSENQSDAPKAYIKTLADYSESLEKMNIAFSSEKSVAFPDLS